eukprot:SAG31_NODE_5915_length_2257_cov_1.947173_1_plen_261_part_10
MGTKFRFYWEVVWLRYCILQLHAPTTKFSTSKYVLNLACGPAAAGAPAAAARMGGTFKNSLEELVAWVQWLLFGRASGGLNAEQPRAASRGRAGPTPRPALLPAQPWGAARDTPMTGTAQHATPQYVSPTLWSPVQLDQAHELSTEQMRNILSEFESASGLRNDDGNPNQPQSTPINPNQSIAPQTDREMQMVGTRTQPRQTLWLYGSNFFCFGGLPVLIKHDITTIHAERQKICTGVKRTPDLQAQLTRVLAHHPTMIAA